MRDSTLWSESLAFRSHLEARNLFTGPTFDQDSVTSLRNREQSMLEDCEVMRSSARNLAALRSLPRTALILLLTPVLTPAVRIPRVATRLVQNPLLSAVAGSGCNSSQQLGNICLHSQEMLLKQTKMLIQNLCYRRQKRPEAEMTPWTPSKPSAAN